MQFIICLPYRTGGVSLTSGHHGVPHGQVPAHRSVLMEAVGGCGGCGENDCPYHPSVISFSIFFSSPALCFFLLHPSVILFSSCLLCSFCFCSILHYTFLLYPSVISFFSSCSVFFFPHHIMYPSMISFLHLCCIHFPLPYPSLSISSLILYSSFFFL